MRRVFTAVFFLLLLLSVEGGGEASNPEEERGIPTRVEQRQERRSKRGQTMRERRERRETERILKLLERMVGKKPADRMPSSSPKAPPRKPFRRDVQKIVEEQRRVHELQRKEREAREAERMRAEHPEETQERIELKNDEPGKPVSPLDLQQRILPRHFKEEAKTRMLLEGEESPPIAGITIFSEDEPMELREVEVELEKVPVSVQYLNVYLGDGTLLGKAVFKRKPAFDDLFYQLDIPRDRQPVIPKAENVRLVVTSILSDAEQGVQAGELLRVRDIEITTLGVWSGNTGIKSSSSILQPQHQVSLALLDDVQRIGETSGILQQGNRRSVGSFRFAIRRSDERAKVSLEQLRFTIAKTSDVTLSAPVLSADGASVSHPCSLSGDRILCVAIPAEVGSLDAPRTLTLSADVSLATGAQNPSLSVSFNDPGAPSSVGDVRWTDGVYSYTWVEEEIPIAEGTVYK